MRFLIVVLVMLCPVMAFCASYEISSRCSDLNPGDGFMEEGSPSNPYVVRDSYGREVRTISTRTSDLNPGDGFMESGSRSNPYIFED